jgi:hypothetical protein
LRCRFGVPAGNIGGRDGHWRIIQCITYCVGWCLESAIRRTGFHSDFHRCRIEPIDEGLALGLALIGCFRVAFLVGCCSPIIGRRVLCAAVGVRHCGQIFNGQQTGRLIHCRRRGGFLHGLESSVGLLGFSCINGPINLCRQRLRSEGGHVVCIGQITLHNQCTGRQIGNTGRCR